MNEKTTALDWKKSTEYDEEVDLLARENRAVRRYCKKHKCDISVAYERLYGDN